MAEVALVDVSKSFGAVEAVRGLSLSIADGEFVVLLGPTGAGKTTTLRLIAGLERPDRGNVVIQRRDVTDEMPELFEDRAEGKFALGVRPENVSFTDSSPLRGRVIGAEYLGTTQIVTVVTASGRIKARLPSSEAVRVGETVGLALRRDQLSLFDAISGQALHSSLYEGGSRG